MSIPIEEHNYIGISKENSEKSCVSSMESKDLNFKATELRLGLPGSESPQNKNENSLGVLKNFPYGAKRGFSDTINGNSGTWGFGSEAKNSVKVGTKILDSVKEATPKSPRKVQEKMSLVSSTNNNGHGVAPTAKAQVVGWPPIRSSRKNMVSNPPKTEEVAGCHYVKVSMDGAPYLRKVDLTIYNSYKDLSSALEKMFSCFKAGQCETQGISVSDGLKESKLVDLLHGSEYVLTYEDKDGDWMLVGDVPWECMSDPLKIIHFGGPDMGATTFLESSSNIAGQLVRTSINSTGMFTESCKKLRIMKSSDANGLAPRATEKFKNR